jgi:pilus assembly protein CpaB
VNPRQRRGVLLLLLAVVGAVLVFVSVSQYVTDVRSEVGDKIPVLRLVQPLEANQPLAAAEVEQVLIPQRWASDKILPPNFDPTGLVAAARIPEGVYLQEGMFEPRSAIEPGEREIAILVDAETGVGGKIVSGDLVDIWATFPAEQTVGQAAEGDEEAEPAEACSAVVVPKARIIDVGLPTTAPASNSTGQFIEQEVVPVTFSIRPWFVSRLLLAESFATTVRLDLIAPEDLDTGLRPSTHCGPSSMRGPIPEALKEELADAERVTDDGQ